MKSRNGLHYSGAIEPTRRVRLLNWDYAQVILSGQPAYYWRLDELSGTTAVDRAGAANGTYTGGYTQGASGAPKGEASAGVAFNGSSGYVACGSLNLSGATLSLECWCYPTAFSWVWPYESTMIACVADGNDTMLNFGTGSSAANNAKPRFVAYNGSSYQMIVWPTQLTANTWYHVVGTYSSGGMNLYVNGIATTPVAVTGSIVASAPTHIGSTPTFGRYFTGTIDEAAIYRRELSAAEVLDHYRAGIRL